MVLRIEYQPLCYVFIAVRWIRFCFSGCHSRREPAVVFALAVAVAVTVASAVVVAFVFAVVSEIGPGFSPDM
jgi:hypothetical protein